jgi:hypothetical protein
MELLLWLLAFAVFVPAAWRDHVAGLRPWHRRCGEEWND